jgi:hypothetical protein
MMVITNVLLHKELCVLHRGNALDYLSLLKVTMEMQKTKCNLEPVLSHVFSFTHDPCV